MSGETRVNAVWSIFTRNRAGYTDVGDIEGSLQGYLTSGGGAIFIQGSGGKVDCIDSCLFKNAAGIGGAILVAGSAHIYSKNSTVSENSAILGGAVAFRHALKAQVYSSYFSNNYGRQSGAIYAAGSEFKYPTKIKYTRKEIRNSNNEKTTIEMFYSKFFGSQALLEGGALMVEGVFLFCKNCTLESNLVQSRSQELDGEGRGIKIKLNALLVLQDSHIIPYQAKSGAGIALENSVMVAVDSSVNGNMASDTGGAFTDKFEPDFSIEDPLSVELCSCSIKENHAGHTGGKNTVVNVIASMTGTQQQHLFKMAISTFICVIQ